MPPFDPITIQSDFPILTRQLNGRPLVYLDNAATSQKPQVVVEAMTEYYFQSNANVHRGVHGLSDESTQAWEAARQQIAQFFGAQPGELIMIRNITEGLNGIAYGWADRQLGEGDVILTALMEHHSNLVPWQQVTARTGARLELIKVDDQGRLDQADYHQKLADLPVKLVAITWVSNALGTVNPVAELVAAARRARPDVRVAIDAAQAAPHLPIDFQKIDADFLTFSGHKMLGPMGSGGLLVKHALLESAEFQPWLFGGGMIAEVSGQTAAFHPEASDRFTAGTPDVASAVGLAAACRYLLDLGMTAVEAHDRQLVEYALQQLEQFPQVRVVGPTEPAATDQDSAVTLDRLGSVAFVYEGVHAHDVAQILDSEGVAVRSGHHCTMPLHHHFDWTATTRASFQVYNTTADIDRFTEALGKVKTVFGR